MISDSIAVDSRMEQRFREPRIRRFGKMCHQEISWQACLLVRHRNVDRRDLYRLRPRWRLGSLRYPAQHRQEKARIKRWNVPTVSFALAESDLTLSSNELWRNNGNGTFTNVTEATGLSDSFRDIAAVGTDFNNDRAIDLLITGGETPKLFRIRERDDLFATGAIHPSPPSLTNGVSVLDFDHDGWMDLRLYADG